MLIPKFFDNLGDKESAQDFSLCFRVSFQVPTNVAQ